MQKLFCRITCIAAVLVCSLANAQGKKTVEVFASINRQKQQADQYSVTVQFKIQKGWHIYADIGDGFEIPTSLELKLPKGVRVSGDWKRPAGLELGDGSKTGYEGSVSFSRTVVVDGAVADPDIGVIVRFQACNDSICNRPQKKTLSVRIENPPEATDLFEKPVRIMAVEKSRTRFKSPAVFDIDDDGRDELFVGSLMGSIDIYKNTNTESKGDPVWVPGKPLEGADGAIRTSNW